MEWKKICLTRREKWFIMMQECDRNSPLASILQQSSNSLCIVTKRPRKIPEHIVTTIQFMNYFSPFEKVGSKMHANLRLSSSNLFPSRKSATSFRFLESNLLVVNLSLASRQRYSFAQEAIHGRNLPHKNILHFVKHIAPLHSIQPNHP